MDEYIGKFDQITFWMTDETKIPNNYQINNITAVKKIDVVDNILYDYRKEQIEIIHVTVDGNRKSNRLNNPADKCSFEF